MTDDEEEYGPDYEKDDAALRAFAAKSVDIKDVSPDDIEIMTPDAGRALPSDVFYGRAVDEGDQEG